MTSLRTSGVVRAFLIPSTTPRALEATTPANAPFAIFTGLKPCSPPASAPPRAARSSPSSLPL